MFGNRAHDLQPAFVVSDTHSRTVTEVMQQILVLLPLHTRYHETGADRQVVDGFEILRASSAHGHIIAAPIGTRLMRMSARAIGSVIDESLQVEMDFDGERYRNRNTVDVLERAFGDNDAGRRQDLHFRDVTDRFAGRQDRAEIRPALSGSRTQV